MSYLSKKRTQRHLKNYIKIVLLERLDSSIAMIIKNDVNYMIG